MEMVNKIIKAATRVKRRSLVAFKGSRTGVGLFYFNAPNTSICSNIKEVINELSLNGNETDRLVQEGHIKYQETIDRSTSTFPSNWNGEKNLSILLYFLIIKVNAQVVVETGVANGISTNMLMAALEQTGGCLHSFDINPMSKNSYRGSGKWNFNLLRSRNPERQIINAMKSLGDVDLWLHDSDHSHWWQTFEYKLAFSKLRKNGYLVSDDVDISTAWAEFAPVNFSSNFVLFDYKKLVGIAQK